MRQILLSKTDRKFYINALDETFIDRYYVWVNDDVITHYLFQGTFPTTKEEASKIYDTYTRSQHNIVLGIYENITNNIKIIGVCGIHEINWVSRTGEFRILIGNRDCWNLGIGKQCLRMIAELAFNKYNLRKLSLGFNADHIAASKTYSDVGFEHEYTIKDGFYRNGKYCDLIYMSLFNKSQ